ncbi:hypothetical protein [Pyrobaculum aerophilum]|uniref:Uncharacterized protein n=2 Tax=Pyrobaculum aerophilum TaxID=13773 RepID=A0A371R0A4_9CREN|nr:hypothetical protein [Pyrobaculum aerophilum]RFA96740.1 hypothetical protein CGL52_10600 [Pyrobaculum aerophilum]
MCVKQWRVENGEVCITEAYKVNSPIYLLTEPFDEEIANAIREWLEYFGVNNEMNIVITDGEEEYVALFPGAVMTLVYKTPKAAEAAYKFIKYLEDTGREYIVNQDAAAMLEITLGVRALPENLRERVEALRSRKEAGGRPRDVPETSVPAPKEEPQAGEIEEICLMLKDISADKLELVKKVIGIVLRNPELLADILKLA